MLVRCLFYFIIFNFLQEKKTQKVTLFKFYEADKMCNKLFSTIIKRFYSLEDFWK